jgi:hypothetical protein
VSDDFEKWWQTQKLGGLSNDEVTAEHVHAAFEFGKNHRAIEDESMLSRWRPIPSCDDCPAKVVCGVKWRSVTCHEFHEDLDRRLCLVRTKRIAASTSETPEVEP